MRLGGCKALVSAIKDACGRMTPVTVSIIEQDSRCVSGGWDAGVQAVATATRGTCHEFWMLCAISPSTSRIASRHATVLHPYLYVGSRMYDLS